MQFAVNEIRNEKGSIMAMVLMIMAVILVIGIIATHETVTEGRIVRNYALAKDNFYRAEAAAKESLQRMDNSTTPLTDLVPSSGGAFGWIHPFGFDLTTAVPTDSNASTLVANAEYLVVYDGVSQGANLDMGEPTRLHSYIVYGRGRTGMATDTSNTVIEIGYRRRF